jgi:hypothetical protein
MAGTLQEAELQWGCHYCHHEGVVLQWGCHYCHHEGGCLSTLFPATFLQLAGQRAAAGASSLQRNDTVIGAARHDTLRSVTSCH